MAADARCWDGKKSGSALLCVWSRVLITSKGVIRNDVVTAPVTAATAFLLRETGLRASPCPKLARRLLDCGRSSEVASMVGKASASSKLDEDACFDVDTICARVAGEDWRGAELSLLRRKLQMRTSYGAAETDGNDQETCLGAYQ